jgi:putative tryptophan/tyrosine transport system substrate-binding protein
VSEASANLVYACDQWEIDLGRRELRSRGIPVPLGGRAFEIVTVLVQSATELVTKDHMMERVWPGAIVGEGTLHVHISAVRKALGPDRAMLKTVSGRGYRLLGSWTPQHREGTAPSVYSSLTRTPGTPPANNFPPLITRLIGRAAAAQFVRDLVSAYRVVTLTGPGGIGKTSALYAHLSPLRAREGQAVVGPSYGVARQRDLLASSVPRAIAQQPATKKRIAIVAPAGKVDDWKASPVAIALFDEMRILGYVEGENLIVDRYSAEGRAERYADIAREATNTQPDAIVSYGAPMTFRLKAVTSTIPIVAATGDPVRQNLISSLSRPGGNITGVSVDGGIEIWGKRLELLSQAVPKLASVAFISTQGGWDGAGGRALREAAAKLGISVVRASLNSPYDEAEYKRVINSTREDRVDGVVFSDETEHLPRLFTMVESIRQQRLPAIYIYREQAEKGGLMAYSYDPRSVSRKLAAQVVEILRGANPADMPYYQLVAFELTINLKTAKELGLDIPAGLVAGATTVIE